MRKTCTVLNFDNLHSLLGLFGRLVFEPTESSDWCWFKVKNSTFSERTKGVIKVYHINSNWNIVQL